MRSKEGWLTVEALRSGMREQYAVIRGIVTHTVELRYVAEYKRPWVTTHQRFTPSGIIESHAWYFDSLDDARRRFRAEQRHSTY